jgi:hypothetical protein
MPKPLSSQHVTFHGEVIEIVERGETRMMKLNLWPCTIDLPMRMPDEPHLGDPITVDALMMITNVEPAVPVD